MKYFYIDAGICFKIVRAESKEKAEQYAEQQMKNRVIEVREATQKEVAGYQKFQKPEIIQ